MPHELLGYQRDDYEGIQLSLFGFKELRNRQQQYAESTKKGIEERRRNVPRRGDMPKGKKHIRHTRR